MSHLLKSTVVVLFSFIAINVFSQDVTGYWKTIDDNSGETKSIVHIYKKSDGAIDGKIVKLYLEPDEDPDPVCTECPKDDYRHGKKINGLVIMSDMKEDGDVCSGGEILDPENGSSYRCKIWLDGDDILKVRGYLGIFFRTQTWQREVGFTE